MKVEMKRIYTITADNEKFKEWMIKEENVESVEECCEVWEYIDNLSLEEIYYFAMCSNWVEIHCEATEGKEV